MFTGIVEELGTVGSVEYGTESAVLRIEGPVVASDTVHGASIAVNGVCLTVTSHDASLGSLRTGDRVNLERAMAASSRFGGHIVQGHVDGTATVTERVRGDRWEVVTFTLPDALARYVVEKGSITVDGVSLTVSAAGPASFSVSLIPTTLELTTLGRKGVGDEVNLEVDVLAKYVERLLVHGPGTAGAADTKEES